MEEAFRYKCQLSCQNAILGQSRAKPVPDCRLHRGQNENKPAVCVFLHMGRVAPVLENTALVVLPGTLARSHSTPAKTESA